MLWMVAGASTDTECLSAESSVDNDTLLRVTRTYSRTQHSSAL